MRIERTFEEELDEAEGIGQGEAMANEEPKRKRGRPRKDASGTPPASAAPKRRGRPPKAANGSYSTLLASLRTERDRLIDKVTALGTAIDALEAIEA